MKDVGGAGFAGSTLPFLGRERVTVNVDVGPERSSLITALATMRPVLLLRVKLEKERENDGFYWHGTFI